MSRIRTATRVFLTALVVMSAGWNAWAGDALPFASDSDLVNLTDYDGSRYVLKPGEVYNSANDIYLSEHLVLSNPGTTLRLDPTDKGSGTPTYALRVDDFTMSAGRLEASGWTTTSMGGGGAGLNVANTFSHSGGEIVATGGYGSDAYGIKLEGTGQQTINGKVTFQSLANMQAIFSSGDIAFGSNTVLVPVIDFSAASGGGGNFNAGSIYSQGKFDFAAGSKLLPYYANTHLLEGVPGWDSTNILDSNNSATGSLDTSGFETLTIGGTLTQIVNGTSITNLHMKANASDYVADANEKTALDYIRDQAVATGDATFVGLNDVQNNMREVSELRSQAEYLVSRMDTNELYDQMLVQHLEYYDIAYYDMRDRMNDTYNYIGFEDDVDAGASLGGDGLGEGGGRVSDEEIAAAVRDRFLSPYIPNSERLALLAAMTEAERGAFLNSLTMEQLLALLARLTPEEAAALIRMFTAEQWEAYLRGQDPEEVLSLVLQFPTEKLQEYLALLTPEKIAQFVAKADLDKVAAFLKGVDPDRFASLFESLKDMLSASELSALFKGMDSAFLTDLLKAVGIGNAAKILAALPDDVLEEIIALVNDPIAKNVIREAVRQEREKQGQADGASAQADGGAGEEPSSLPTAADPEARTALDELPKADESEGLTGGGLFQAAIGMLLNRDADAIMQDLLARSGQSLADFFGIIQPGQAQVLAEKLSPAQLAELLGRIHPDTAARFLAALDQATAESVLAAMPDSVRGAYAEGVNADARFDVMWRQNQEDFFGLSAYQGASILNELSTDQLSTLLATSSGNDDLARMLAYMDQEDFDALLERANPRDRAKLEALRSSGGFSFNRDEVAKKETERLLADKGVFMPKRNDYETEEEFNKAQAAYLEEKRNVEKNVDSDLRNLLISSQEQEIVQDPILFLAQALKRSDGFELLWAALTNESTSKAIVQMSAGELKEFGMKLHASYLDGTLAIGKETFVSFLLMSIITAVRILLEQ